MTIVFALVFLFVLVHVRTNILECSPSKTEVERSLIDAYIAGVAAVVVNATYILYEQGFGSMKPPIFCENLPVDPIKSIFLLVSISKTFIPVSAMQPVEQYLLDLDANLNHYLAPGMRVHHPLYPNHTITMRHILSPTSGIGSNFAEDLTHFSSNDDFTKTIRNRATLLKCWCQFNYPDYRPNYS
ncbi:unnamed protein product [Rotaria sp. Silwood1]|nr:unnamed protein product [Rotaria sp. Silwood1]